MTEDAAKQPVPPDDLTRKIERAKQELEQMIDLNPQIMLMVDGAGIVMRANRALLDLLGLKGYQDVIGRRLHEIFPSASAEFFNALLEIGPESETMREAVIVQEAGQHRILRFTIVESGASANLNVVIVDDVTHEKEKAAALEKEHKKHAVQVLMGALMHNINQPLTVIMAKAHLMQLALEQNTMRPGDMKQSLKDIMKFTMEIAALLERVEHPKDFVTESYLPDMDILDIDRSAPEPAEPLPASAVVLDTLMSMLERREPGSAAHSIRAGDFAVLLADRLKMSEREKDRLKFCGVFHDIGKIGIPDRILRKPGILTDSERTIMRAHVDVGYNLLHSFHELKKEADIIHAHHERYDGSGYPRGLAGSKIPKGARILALVDAFDALRFTRSYQKSRPLDAVVDEILAGSGTQFDPEVVTAFRGCYAEMDRLHSQPTDASTSRL